jgi:dihydroorotate dehydrogenase
VSLYAALARPILFALDAERAHDLTMAALRVPGVPALLRVAAAERDPRLQQRTFGVTFRNPIGLAAGLDKQAAAIPAWSALGFGFAEIGTVTPQPQPGNPQPRLFRLRADRAVINRFGFNSAGADAVAHNLERARRNRQPADAATPALRVGVNIGKNKTTSNAQAVEDYVSAVTQLHSYADYIVINVSSPNTAGLRSLQDGDALEPLVRQVVATIETVARRDIPVLVKVSPDLTDEELLASVDAAATAGARGVIATNTTTARSGLRSEAALVEQAGGLSGAPLRSRAEDVCRVLFRHFRGRLPIIGVGGIFTADEAYQRIRSGAALVQVYTGFIYEGPTVVSRLNAGIAERLERDGFSNVADAVGVDADR